MAEPPRKKIRATQSQTEYLVSYMARNRQFALGSFTTDMGLQAHNDQWQSLALELAEIGPAKTVDQWKISWRDLKCRAKANYARAKRANKATRILKEVPALSPQDNLILDILGKVTSQGLPGVPESPIGEAATRPTQAQCVSLKNEQASPDPLASVSPSGSPQLEEGLHAEADSDSDSAHPEEQTNLLKEIANHLKERNEIERERNKILRRKNRTLAAIFFQVAEDD